MQKRQKCKTKNEKKAREVEMHFVLNTKVDMFEDNVKNTPVNASDLTTLSDCGSISTVNDTDSNTHIPTWLREELRNAQDYPNLSPQKEPVLLKVEREGTVHTIITASVRL